MTTYHLLRTQLVAALRRQLDPAEAAAEARLWISWGLGRDSAWLATHGAELVPEKELRQLRGWLRRREAGEPLPQILGWAPFCGRRFKVTRDVMIPRAHSEAACRAALRWGAELGIRSCVDVGTGCGNLAITLALESTWEIWGTELSPSALKVARANARVLGAKVTLHEGSLLEPLDKAPELVVANLPYVDPSHLPDMDAELAFEPQVALVSPGTGIDLNRRLLQEAHLKGARACLLEHGPGQGADLLQAAKDSGWAHGEVSPDALGHDHLLRVWR